MKLVLFDIDGTLIDSGGAGTRSLNLAFRELFSINNAFNGISMAGKTDIEIMKEALVKNNISLNDETLDSILSSYLMNLKKEINNSNKHVKPGIKAALETLFDKDGIRLGLLSGNIEKGARIKLGTFGLNSYFSFGAFGSDNEDRNKLLPIAVKKFRAHYRENISFGDCIIVGDTPRDVECAKPYGALSVAVATGPYTLDTLREAGADLAMEDITDIDKFMDFIG
jgi:phosphoglycolate phosphatase-like HAD superfamily hydrolase